MIVGGHHPSYWRSLNLVSATHFSRPQLEHGSQCAVVQAVIFAIRRAPGTVNVDAGCIAVTGCWHYGHGLVLRVDELQAQLVCADSSRAIESYAHPISDSCGRKRGLFVSIRLCCVTRSFLVIALTANWRISHPNVIDSSIFVRNTPITGRSCFALILAPLAARKVVQRTRIVGHVF